MTSPEATLTLPGQNGAIRTELSNGMSSIPEDRELIRRIMSMRFHSLFAIGNFLGVAVIVATCLGIAVSGAVAQKATDLVGTWTLESDNSTTADGRTVQQSGSRPQGIAMFDSAGHFVIVNTSASLPKFASNDRMHGTAAENEAIVHGSIAFFGTYSIADGIMIQHIEGGTWPGWTGTDQKRTITSFTGDELTWTTVSTFGAKSELHWKRLK